MKRISFTSLVNRREVLAFIGGTAAVTLVGCLRGQSTSAKAAGTSTPTSAQTSIPTTSAQTTSTQTTSATPPTCVVKPQQTEGPYFVDEKLNRSDIRSDPSDGLVKQDVPLRLVFLCFSGWCFLLHTSSRCNG